MSPKLREAKKNKSSDSLISPGTNWKYIGRFAYDPTKLLQRQIRQLHKISFYYTDEIVERLLEPVANASFDISLRLLDYCCTTVD